MIDAVRDLVDFAHHYQYADFLTTLESILDFYDAPVAVIVSGDE